MAITIIDAHPILSERLHESWHIDARTVSSGPSLSGREQIIRSPMPVWRAKITPLVLEGTQKGWHAFLSRLSGRGNAVRLGVVHTWARNDIYGRFGMSWATEGHETMHSDGASFSDGAGYALPGIEMALSTSAIAHDTAVQVSVAPFVNGFQDGDKISIDGNLHHVTTVASLSAGVARLGIEPPLRRAATAGTSVDLFPKIVMRLADDMQGRFDRHGDTPMVASTIDLVELPELG